jgi:transcriptional regulator
LYQTVQFREDRLAVQHDLIRANPLGLLVSAGAGGLVANPIPFVIDSARGDKGTLRCHVARANPQWQDLAAVEECLVVFQGSQAYITPSWYPTKHEHGKVVPTWNYVMVHAWGRPHIKDDADWVRQQIDALTELQEGPRSPPWKVGDAPAPFVASQTKAIVGIEIPISRIEGKWKVSQNRSEADRAGVQAGLQERGPDSQQMAALVAERGGWANRS